MYKKTAKHWAQVYAGGEFIQECRMTSLVPRSSPAPYLVAYMTFEPPDWKVAEGLVPLLSSYVDTVSYGSVPEVHEANGRFRSNPLRYCGGPLEASVTDLLVRFVVA